MSVNLPVITRPNSPSPSDESEATTSFLTQLSTWDKQELDEKLARRVQVSKRAVAKILQAFDRVVQRNEKITLALKGELTAENGTEVVAGVLVGVNVTSLH